MTAAEVKQMYFVMGTKKKTSFLHKTTKKKRVKPLLHLNMTGASPFSFILSSYSCSEKPGRFWPSHTESQ